MMGGPTAPVDENIFANESWMKSAAAAAILNLQIALNAVNAGTAGENAILNTLQTSVVNVGLLNGSIITGKAFTPAQKSYIAQVTGVQNAWIQVQNDGYWLDVEIVPYVDPTTELPGYECTYLLVYSKGDVVRFVSGNHVLI
jgi:hypothetical protein